VYYDWANSAFATTVIAGFFPLFFKQYWSDGVESTTSTFWLGLGNSAASFLILLLAPILGAVADTTGAHKRLLALFAGLGILATAAFFLVSKGQWSFAISIYVIAIIGFSGANVFYDALLPKLTTQDDLHRLSALGYSMGYLGGGLLFLVNVAMTLKPHWFGLADAAMAVRVSFLTVALWWFVFSIPLMLGVKSQKPTSSGAFHLGGEFKKLWNTLSAIRQHNNLWLFLLAYWFYIDGVATIIRMAVDYGIAIGLPSNSLIVALLLVQFIGFPATLLFGMIGHKHGAKRGLWIGLWAYVLATAAAGFMTNVVHFYVLAAVLGLVQGGVQSLSRSLFSQLIPAEKSGEYFGFLNMLGKAAAVLGPLLVGVVAATTNNNRIGLLSILLLFVAGMWFLRKVEEAPVKTDT